MKYAHALVLGILATAAPSVAQQEDASSRNLRSRGAGSAAGVDLNGDAYTPAHDASLRNVCWVGTGIEATYRHGNNDDVAAVFASEVYGSARDELYLSASVMHNGSVPQSGLQAGKFPLQSVGLDDPSTGGSGPEVKAEAFPSGIDTVYRPTEHIELSVNYGRGAASDDLGFGRDFSWLMVQPRLKLSDTVFAVARYSEIGTHQNTRGYILDGRLVAQDRAVGYKTQPLQRISAGLGWETNSKALVKLEVGKDWVELSDGPTFRPQTSQRTYYGLQVVLSF